MNTFYYAGHYFNTPPSGLKAEVAGSGNRIEWVKVSSPHTIALSIALAPMAALLLIVLITEIDTFLGRHFYRQKMLTQLQRITFLERLLKIESHHSN